MTGITTYLSILTLNVNGLNSPIKRHHLTKQAGVAILISDKVNFKPTLIKRDKERHSVLIKGEIHQKEITIINLYAPNGNALNFIKHTMKDLKAYTNSNTVVVGDFNTKLSSADRSSKQKNQ
jgi:exonuclease III